MGSILGSPCREAANTVLVWRYMIQFKDVGFMMPSVYGERKEMMFPVDQVYVYGDGWLKVLMVFYKF